MDIRIGNPTPLRINLVEDQDGHIVHTHIEEMTQTQTEETQSKPAEQPQNTPPRVDPMPVFKMPVLSAQERQTVYKDIVKMSRKSTDFVVLITLASVIASVGLVQNSMAALIGSMIVAPLMAPILALSMALIKGNMRLMQRAASTAAIGIVAAIGVGVVTSLLTGAPPTEAMTSRTEPNVLDMVLAIATAAAGAYITARKQNAGAAPGVAIAISLVPPLGVVGYGLATLQFALASGALLLFLTNMAAAVVVSAAVFWLLGFRPVRQEQRYRSRRGLVAGMTSVLTVMAVLLL
jgi:uncharacterized hydrophobic protein (TIGR00271 family)